MAAAGLLAGTTYVSVRHLLAQTKVNFLSVAGTALFA
jgi:hypothetical protein